MRMSAIVVFAFLTAASAAFADPSPVHLTELTTEHMAHPVGIGVAQPRLSWKLQSTDPVKCRQLTKSALLPQLTSSINRTFGRLERSCSDQSVLVRWAGKPLDSRAVAFWQVRVWDKADNVSDWSDPHRLNWAAASCR
jgi:alpha-L-rhamnosidase